MINHHSGPPQDAETLFRELCPQEWDGFAVACSDLGVRLSHVDVLDIMADNPGSSNKLAADIADDLEVDLAKAALAVKAYGSLKDRLDQETGMTSVLNMGEIPGDSKGRRPVLVFTDWYVITEKAFALQGRLGRKINLRD